MNEISLNLIIFIYFFFSMKCNEKQKKKEINKQTLYFWGKHIVNVWWSKCDDPPLAHPPISSDLRYESALFNIYDILTLFLSYRKSD